MADLPPDAIRVVLAAVVPCPFSHDDEFDLRACANNKGRRCSAGICLGDGTRTIVTDVEVERFGMVWDHSPLPMSLPWLWREEGSPLGPNETHVWREVPRD